ncbi:MAG: hypothetical protein QF787_17810, partial [Nitrospinota bacterium]|nr:hypothetical protein [Nitrospinota bacterium]
ALIPQLIVLARPAPLRPVLVPLFTLDALEPWAVFSKHSKQSEDGTTDRRVDIVRANSTSG